MTSLQPQCTPMIPANDDIMVSFPNPTIDPIIILPTYETMNKIHLKLNQKESSVNSYLGDGLNSLLTLNVSSPVYNTMSTVAFVIPTNPGPHTAGIRTA